MRTCIIFYYTQFSIYEAAEPGKYAYFYVKRFDVKKVTVKTILIVYKGRITYIVYSKTVVFRKFDLFISYFVNIVAGTNVPVRSGTFVPAGINDAKKKV